MKTFLKLLLQRILGFENYLFWFSVYKIKFLKWDNFEKPLFSLFDKIPKQGTILDIGANIGIISYHFAKNFPQSKVIAFEPVPFNQRAFAKICRFFKLTTISLEKYALGNNNEINTIYVPVKNQVKMQGLASIKEINTSNAISFQIEVKRLDDDLKLADEPITAIKIDVENFEYEVLLGAKQTIEQNKPLLYIELWDNSTRKNVIHFLTTLGYKMYYFNNKTWENCGDKPPKTVISQNFLFLHGSKTE